MTTKERMKDFLASEGISEGAFEKRCGLSKGFVSNIGDSIRKSSIDKILKEFPSLDTVWLLTGTFSNTNTGYNLGSIGGNNRSTYNNVGNFSNEDTEFLKQKIELLELRLKEKDDIIQAKNETIETKNEIIENLKNKMKD